jgi:hypothetical protein
MTDPVNYKVIDQPWSPSNPSIAETMLNAQGQQGWRLVIAWPDSRRERTRWVFSQSAAAAGTLMLPPDGESHG